MKGVAVAVVLCTRSTVNGTQERRVREKTLEKLGQNIKHFGPGPASEGARKAAKQNCTLMWMVVESTRTQTTKDSSVTGLIISLPFFIKRSFCLSFTV